MRRHARAALLAPLALVLACSRSPVVRYHTLRPIPPAPAEAAGCESLAVALGPAELARYLDRPQIVRRSGATGIRYDPLHRWAEDLESELLRVIGRNLTTLLSTHRIVVYPSSAPFPLDYRVTLDVQQLDAESGGELVVRIRWMVHPPGGEPPLAVEVSEIRRTDAPRETDALVGAYSDALASLSRDIARRVCGLEAEARGDNRPPDFPAAAPEPRKE